MPGNRPVVIRRATPDQAGILTRIAFAAKRHRGYPERWIETWSPLLTISAEFIEKHETYVACVDGQPVGFYAISLKENKANLEHLWVRPEHIGQDIGSEMFHHTLDRCKELGAHALEIESDPNAQGFYERKDAKKVGEHVGELDSQLRMLPVMEITLF